MTTSAAIPSLLVLRDHGLGDLLTAQPALHGLRRHFPKHDLVVTCPSWLVPLAAYLGTADRIVCEPFDVAGADPSDHQRIDHVLLENIRRTVPRADVLVSLRTPGPELLPIVTAYSPRQLVSYRYAPIEATHLFPELDFSDHILKRWDRLLSVVGVALRDEDLYAQMQPPDTHRRFTIVHAGAGSPSRRWPVRRWSAVVRFLEFSGHRVLLTGSAAESERVGRIRRAAGLPVGRDRAGRTPVLELAAYVAGARLVVSADSGLSHLATTFRTPAVTLFGPVSPAWWGPPAGHPRHKTLWTGRHGDNYASRLDPGLAEIQVDAVIGAIEELQAEGV